MGKSAQTPLHAAAVAGRTEEIDSLLRQDPTLARRVCGKDRRLAIHDAAKGGHATAVQRLLAVWPESAEAKDSNGYLPLHYAAVAGDITSVRALLEAFPGGSEIATTDWCESKDYPIHLAAFCGHTAAVEALLKLHPAGARLLNGAKDTPLHKAAQGGHTEVIRALLKVWPEGAKVNNKYKRTPLLYAAGSQSLESVKVLLAAFPEGAQSKDDQNEIPLMNSGYDPAEIFKLLLEAWPEGADHVNKNGKTVLHAVANSPDAVDMLVLLRPELVKRKDTQGWTPIHSAAYRGRGKAVRTMLQAWPEGIHAKAKDGKTPLAVAREAAPTFQNKDCFAACTPLAEAPKSKKRPREEDEEESPPKLKRARKA